MVNSKDGLACTRIDCHPWTLIAGSFDYFDSAHLVSPESKIPCSRAFAKYLNKSLTKSECSFLGPIRGSDPTPMILRICRRTSSAWHLWRVESGAPSDSSIASAKTLHIENPSVRGYQGTNRHDPPILSRLISQRQSWSRTTSSSSARAAAVVPRAGATRKTARWTSSRSGTGGAVYVNLASHP
jgi:hypothetical protein